MKIKHAINLHKGLTSLVILALMAAYDNFSTVAFIYLVLHGGYGILWLLKEKIGFILINNGNRSFGSISIMQ